MPYIEGSRAFLAGAMIAGSPESGPIVSQISLSYLIFWFSSSYREKSKALERLPTYYLAVAVHDSGPSMKQIFQAG